MAKVKKAKKMDQKLVSREKFEIAYIAKKFKVSQKIVRAVKKEVGRSRRAIYAKLREMGY